MSARDKVFGRQGGRIVDWVEMNGEAVHIVCRCGYSEAGRFSVGKLCQVCLATQREMDAIDWRIRRYERARPASNDHSGLALLILDGTSEQEEQGVGLRREAGHVPPISRLDVDLPVGPTGGMSTLQPDHFELVHGASLAPTAGSR